MASSQVHLNVYSRIETHVLSRSKIFFKDAEANLPGGEARLDISTEHNRSLMSELFMENGLIGMVQAFHLHSVSMVLSFFRVAKDVFCGNEASPKIPELVT